MAVTLMCSQLQIYSIQVVRGFGLNKYPYQRRRPTRDRGDR
jgi:hypothetical protein